MQQRERGDHDRRAARESEPGGEQPLAGRPGRRAAACGQVAPVERDERLGIAVEKADERLSSGSRTRAIIPSLGRCLRL
ncbi:MAG TPA: hypothetical protein VKV21_12000 [Solirubrobacteraceae bacterium]|nr:hypothetical protein [Solirubrobacteraceae bacterium]